MNKSVLILTSIKPNKHNKNGPSGLIWECQSLLNQYCYNCDLLIIKDRNKLNKLGIYLKKINIEKIDKYDIILIYPFHIYFKLDKKARSKTIVLGPDSPSLLFKRFYNVSKGINKIKYFILKNWFLYKERKMLKNVSKFLVVRENDSRWLKYNHFNYSKKIFYLTHPILTSVVETISKVSVNCEKYKKYMLIFSGDMSKKYVGDFINEFSLYINKVNLDILIVGKNNKWIYELFKIKCNRNKVQYIEWIDNYNCICNPKYHIHIVPLIAGAGTKNRVLTACAMGVPVFSTFIGLENIYYGKPKNFIFKFKTIEEIIVKLSNLEDIFKNVPTVDDTVEYINRVNNRYKKEFLDYLGLKNDNS